MASSPRPSPPSCVRRRGSLPPPNHRLPSGHRFPELSNSGIFSSKAGGFISYQETHFSMDWLTSNLLKLLGVLGLVLVNGFFVAAELSLVRIRETQIEPLANRGNRRAKIVRRLIQNLDATISAIQFGITLANLGVGVLLEPVFQAVLTPLYDVLGVQSDAVRHLSAIVTGFVVSCFL